MGDLTDDEKKDVSIILNSASLGAESLVKGGVWFTVVGQYGGLYTGDLFYNMVTKQFRMTGIPYGLVGPRHAVKDSEPGPFKINLWITHVVGHRVEGNYGVIEFTEAQVSGEFMAWVEEMHFDKPIYEAARLQWTVAEGILVWQR
jgi:hypothetical protein